MDQEILDEDSIKDLENEIVDEKPGEKTKQPGFEELSDEGKPSEPKDIKFLLDIPLVVSVELGRKKMLINDLLKLVQGSVVELDKLADEPMDILINNKLIARGEIVVINDKFGIRLTTILKPEERIKQLK